MSLIRAIALATLIPAVASAGPLNDTISALEDRLDARIGVAVLDTATGARWSHREDERFLMNSTVKVPLCAAVLAADIPLDERLPVTQGDIVEYAPVTERLVGSTMSVGDLCLAAVDQSDNTATNILFERLGGPSALTAFLRQTGDVVTRSDRTEPELNTFSAGDPRDTTTPSAMIATLQAVLKGNGQLVEWMRPGGVTGALLRPSVPSDWDVADKSGSGRHNRNIVAMLTPPTGAPIYAAIFISDTDADFDARNAAITEIGAALVDELTSQ